MVFRYGLKYLDMEIECTIKCGGYTKIIMAQWVECSPMAWKTWV